MCGRLDAADISSVSNEAADLQIFKPALKVKHTCYKTQTGRKSGLHFQMKTWSFNGIKGPEEGPEPLMLSQLTSSCGGEVPALLSVMKMTMMRTISHPDQRKVCKGPTN